MKHNMTTVDDLIRTYNEDDSSLSSEDIEDDDCVKGGEEEEEEEVKDIDALVQPRNPPTGTSIDNEDTEDDTVAEDKSKTKSVSPDTPAPSVTDNEEEVILTQRDWQRKFVKKNPLYKRCKIRYSEFCYIKPRTPIPETGKPVLYVCEGVENWSGPPNLLCGGQLIFIDEAPYVVIVVLWIGCLIRTRPTGSPTYSPAAKKMQVLLCPRDIFDNDDNDLGAMTDELRYVLVDVHPTHHDCVSHICTPFESCLFVIGACRPSTCCHRWGVKFTNM